jgi:hypothetical protein
MRRLLVLIGVLTLMLPAGAGALKGSPGDGTLVVENAQGVIGMTVRGGIIGRFDQGTVVIDDPLPNDGPPPIVKGYQKARVLGPRRTQYSGSDVRFRLIGGLYRARITAIGLDVSVVGRGTVLLDGSGFADQPGHFSINDLPFQAFPSVPTRFTLGTTLPGIVVSK